MSDFIYHNPIILNEEALLSEAINLFQKNKTDNIIVINENENLVGILDIQNIIQKKIIT